MDVMYLNNNNNNNVMYAPSLEVDAAETTVEIKQIPAESRQHVDGQADSVYATESRLKLERA